MHAYTHRSIYLSIHRSPSAGWLAGWMSKSTHSFKYRDNNREDIGRGSRDRKESTTITPLGYACLSVCLSVCHLEERTRARSVQHFGSGFGPAAASLLLLALYSGKYKVMMRALYFFTTHIHVLLCCSSSQSSSPDRPIHNFRASVSGILCTLETSRDGF